MATPERAEDRIPMSELLASCVAASAVSTPPRRAEPEAEARDGERERERDEAA
ncbi:hypothetical protein [Streptomyces sp. NBC_01216]|uniref:hypothetical protein n=1 Tax=unclassified Streptomyces TaxID=2593676 RepID=UPI002E13CC5B|nr:hypothetical protein OG393_12055 [Streptomyces sp. NBC_01216]